MQTKYDINDEVFVVAEDGGERFYGVFRIKAISISCDRKTTYDCTLEFSPQVKDMCMDYIFTECEIFGKMEGQKKHIRNQIEDIHLKESKKVNEYYESMMTVIENFSN